MLDRWPVDYPQITQLFGANSDYYSDLSQHPSWSYPGHNGLDMVGSQKIVAPLKATVTKTGYEAGGYGNYVRLTQGSFHFYFAHMQLVVVRLNMEVESGEYIGIMDNTGCSFGEHLHFGIKGLDVGDGYKGYIDPLPLLPSINAEPEPLPVLDWNESGLATVVSSIGVRIRHDPNDSAYIQGAFNKDAIIPYQEVIKFEDGKYVWLKVAEGLYSCAQWEEEVIIKPIDN